MTFCRYDLSDVVLGLGPWLSLRTKSQSLVLALSLESLLTSLISLLVSNGTNCLNSFRPIRILVSRLHQHLCLHSTSP